MKTKLLFLSLFAAVSANAQIYYDFGTTTAMAGVSSGVPTGWTSSVVTRVNTRTNCTSCGSTNTTNGSANTYAGASGAYNFSMNPEPNTNYHSYITFTITPSTGQEVGITSLSFGARSSTSGPASLALRTSVDNYSADVASFNFDARGTWELKSVAFENSLRAGVNNPLVFRLYLNGPATSADPSFRIDDITINYDTTLPVSLYSFTANTGLNSVWLKWNTVSELNNSHFEVLRSGTNQAFQLLGTVKGAGSSSVQNSYSFEDHFPLQGPAYYKLRQVDINGTAVSSDVIKVETAFAEARLSAFAVSENQLQVNAAVTNGGRGVLSINNMNGQSIIETDVQLIKGNNIITLPLTLQPGIYVASLVSGNEKLNVKFLK